MSETEWFSGRAVEDPEARMERRELRKIVGIVMLVGLAIGLFLGMGGWAFATEASEPKAEPSLVFRAMHEDGSPVVLRIFITRPCTDDRVLMRLVHEVKVPRHIVPFFKAATLTWQGRDWASCWIQMQGRVVSIDEEGAPFQAVPMGSMRDEGT